MVRNSAGVLDMGVLKSNRLTKALTHIGNDWKLTFYQSSNQNWIQVINESNSVYLKDVQCMENSWSHKITLFIAKILAVSIFIIVNSSRGLSLNIIHNLFCGSFFFFAARAGMHMLVKDYLKRRRDDEDKADRLFIDSILECEFMDEQEVVIVLMLILKIVLDDMFTK